MSNFKINNMNLRDHKSFKLIYKFNILKKCLQTNNFILFFYYDFLNSQTRLELKKQLKNNNLKLIILKKNSMFNYLSNSKFKFINNLLKDNIILIYDKNNNIIDQQIIKNLLKMQNLKLVGCLWDKKYYRPTKINKYSKLTDNVKLNFVLILKNQLDKIKFTLSNLNKIN